MNLVFASGFLIPQRLFRMEYFRGLHAAFPGAVFPLVPITGTIEERARALATYICSAFPAGPVHIVGHSRAVHNSGLGSALHAREYNKLRDSPVCPSAPVLAVILSAVLHRSESGLHFGPVDGFGHHCRQLSVAAVTAG